MRLDKDGNLLLSTTSFNNDNAGIGLGASNFFYATRDGNLVASFNRLSSDGTIADFRKDGTTVGSIAARSGDLLIGTTNVGLRFDDNASAYVPFDVTNSVARDAGIDLGASSARFKDLYLSGEIYNTAAYNQTTGLAANMYVNSAGRFFRSTSSERYKNTIQDATHGLTELLTLRPVTYKGNDDGDVVFGGLIAEEVHDAGLTEFVQYNEENQPDALAYGNMVSLCIKAIQEQQDLIESLTARVAQLEGAN